MTTLDEVLTTQTEAQIFEELVIEAASRDVDVRGLPDRSFPRAMLQIEALSHSKFQAKRKALVEGRLLDLVTDAAQAYLLARGFFQLNPAPATYAVHEFQVTDTGGVGPKPIKAQERLFVSSTGQEFRNTEDVLVPLNGSAPVKVKAEVSGVLGNVQPNTVTKWRTPIAGLSVTNPAIGASGSSILASARDKEGIASIVTRCRDRWGTQGRAGNDAAYRSWVVEAWSGASQVCPITRMKIRNDNPYGAGSIGVVLANASGPALPAEVTQANAYLQPRKALGTGRLVTEAAIAEALPLQVVLYVLNNSAAIAQAGAVVTQYESELDLGATVYPNELVQRLMGVQGVYNLTMNAPAVVTTTGALSVVSFTPRTFSLG